MQLISITGRNGLIFLKLSAVRNISSSRPVCSIITISGFLSVNTFTAFFKEFIFSISNFSGTSVFSINFTSFSSLSTIRTAVFFLDFFPVKRSLIISLSSRASIRSRSMIFIITSVPFSSTLRTLISPLRFFIIE